MSYRYKKDNSTDFDYIKEKSGKSLFRIPSFSDRIFFKSGNHQFTPHVINSIIKLNNSDKSYYKTLNFIGSDHRPITGILYIRKNNIYII